MVRVRRKSHQGTTRESLAIDVSTIVSEGRQHRAYSVEGPSRESNLFGQPYDVPHKEEHDSEGSEPAQHRALGPSEERRITAQEFPQTGHTDHRIRTLSLSTTDSFTAQDQTKSSQLSCHSQQRQKLPEIP